METRIQKAEELHNKGYNCAQSVACAYCELLSADYETVLKATEALGGGMGGRKATCGAVSGACILAGLKASSGNRESPNTKQACYALSKEIVDRFLAMNGSVVCEELKGEKTGAPLRSCAGCIEDAARLVEEIVFG